MTNREMLIKALTDDFDDPGETESVIAYRIACPYYDGRTETPCAHETFPFSTIDICGPCTMKWLDEEVAE